MASKNKSIFSCTSCGAQSPKWAGQCPECQAWNALVETVAASGTDTAHRYAGYAAPEPVRRLEAVEINGVERVSSGIAELDRVLGGGLVRGSVIVLGGDPGIGKSTLLLQGLAEISQHLGALYVSGEESAQQIALRAKRLGVNCPDLKLLAENCLETIIEAAADVHPQVLVIGSIQTLYTNNLQSAPGSVAQVRETAAQLVRFAKHTGTVVILVGHVTKEGLLAGPRVLEHMVDTVLYFEGDRSSSFRLVRSFKNRFGAVNEIGVFAMTDGGLKEVTNPSAMFVSRDRANSPGSATLVTQEGTRPLLVEVQALVDKSPLANPRRLTVGLDSSRLAMLLAILHRHAHCVLYDQDVFVSVVGGVRVVEPAADLAICIAVVSSLRNQAFPLDTVVFGEVGLSGEVRPVQRGIDRVREALKLGFTRAIIPDANTTKHLPDAMTVISARRIGDAIEHAFG
jgi:DNA repair protein RadA/Sms